MSRTLEISVWLILVLLTVILPNAFKEISAGLLVLLGIFYAFSSYRQPINATFVTLWIAACIVTVTYLAVGYLDGAPSDAMIQVPIVYVACPILWAFALHGALLRYGLKNIVRVLLIATLLAILSQAFYFWAFTTFGPQAVEFMGSNPNVDFGGDSAAAVMHVFGSMIFLYGGIIACPQVVKTKWMRYGLIMLVIASAFTSGRGALIISMIIGVVLNTVFTLAGRRGAIVSSATNAILAVAGLSIVSYTLAYAYQIDIFVSIYDVFDKIVTGGGAQRQDYLPLLLYGFFDHHFLGVGHGIGVQYVASEEFPWRYELVWIATLYRVGIIGALVYALPFIVSIWKSLYGWRSGLLTSEEKYLSGGLISAFLAANTNPYIEAYVFQWMYVLPCLYFTQVVISRRKPGQSSIVQT